MSLVIKGSLLAVLLTYSTTIYDVQTKKIAKRDKDRECLVEALTHEVLNQPLKGQKAVLDVISNRVKAKGFPGSICAVVHASKAFSYRNHLKAGVPMVVKFKNNIDKAAVQRIENLVDFFLHGDYKPVLGPNVLWYTRSEIQTVWMKKMKIHATIGSHKFLEEI